MSAPISQAFFEDLKSGMLQPLLAKVQTDDTLMLAFRGASINVYYRGGSILRLSAHTRKSGYAAHFDKNYAANQADPLPDLPLAIDTYEDCRAWVKTLSLLKEVMNAYFSSHAKTEREFQQIVAWENNRSKISNSTEYFITDIEYTGVEQSARIDMLGLRWLAGDRKFDNRCRPVLIEMKYGTDAYDGAAGIAKHVADLNAILSNAVKRNKICKLIASQFNMLDSLKLINFNKSSAVQAIQVSDHPEVVFLLANNNPRSTKLLSALNQIEETPHFDLRFFAASFAGYGLHDSCMLNLSQVKSRCLASR